MLLLDCTLRDGGYYNAWDFPEDMVQKYLDAIHAADVDVVEIGFRSLSNSGFKGPYAFSTDSLIRGLAIPDDLQIGVMVNGSELIDQQTQEDALSLLFPLPCQESPIDLVRVACHVNEFAASLPAANWLKSQGYRVGFNLMQVADRNEEEIKSLAELASSYPLDVLYFADSTGSLKPDQTAKIIHWLRDYWKGSLGIHTHDNLGLALSNTLRALDEGVTWVDSTVTGMGRGPGNARTEELAIEIAEIREKPVNLTHLMALVREEFLPMQQQYGWGTNPYYYLAGKFGIHPSYVQQMLNDPRYSEEDIFSVIQHLHARGGKHFKSTNLDVARNNVPTKAIGSWSPKQTFDRRNVLLLGTGPGVRRHRKALERFIQRERPLVVALNTLKAINPDLIDFRVACHPVRLQADCEEHTRLPQPLIAPLAMLPPEVRKELSTKEILDFGLDIETDTFEFRNQSCTVPVSMVFAYALAACTSGGANCVFLAGFDGYSSADPRMSEMKEVLNCYQESTEALTLTAVTPTAHGLPTVSIYGL